MEELLICPVCGRALRRGETAFSCPKGHCFDIARQGYVNLLPVTRKHSLHPGDTRDMALARRSFLEKGVYRPIADTVAALLSAALPESPRLLDAGCGEGYYLRQLMETLPGGTFFGVDISKDAVRLAAGKDKRALWITASAAHLPVKTGCLDGVMSMFALTAAEEFHRVLKPGGQFLEVTAGRGHLMGLKRLIYPEILEKREKSAGYPGFALKAEKTLEFSFTLRSHEEIMALLTMTPHVWRISREGARRAEAAEVLTDTAQVEFRLYEAVETSAGL